MPLPLDPLDTPQPVGAVTRCVEVRDDEQVVASATVDLRPGDAEVLVRADLHARPGLPAGSAARIVDAVALLPEVTSRGGHLSAGLDVGDSGALQRLRERADDVRTHLAGGTCVVEAHLPAVR